MTSALNDTLKLYVASRAFNVRRDRKQANVFLFIEFMPYGGVGTAGRTRELLREVRLRFHHARQVDLNIPARCRYRSLVSAI